MKSLLLTLAACTLAMAAAEAPIAGDWMGSLDINGKPLRIALHLKHDAARLNHLFQPCKTGEVSEYLSIEQTMAPEGLDLIADWIAKRAG